MTLVQTRRTQKYSAFKTEPLNRLCSEGSIKKDSTLDLQFRSNYIDIYYRGGKVLNLTKNTRGYTAKIDKNYFQNEQVSFIENIQSANDMQTWISQLPLIKQARDFHYTENKNTAEREFQQLIIRSNNYERTSNSSDFFITDMEYDFKIETAGTGLALSYNF